MSFQESLLKFYASRSPLSLRLLYLHKLCFMFISKPGTAAPKSNLGNQGLRGEIRENLNHWYRNYFRNVFFNAYNKRCCWRDIRSIQCPKQYLFFFNTINRIKIQLILWFVNLEIDENKLCVKNTYFCEEAMNRPVESNKY